MTVEAFTRHSLRNTARRVRWLVVGGETGSGKTHAAKRIVRRFRDCRIWAWEAGYWGGSIPNAAFWRWQKLAELEEDEWKEVLEEITGGNQLRGADLLVIDDLGAETDKYRSGVPVARLQTVLEVMEFRWLVVTTNVTRAQWEKRWDKRISSRLQAAAYVNLFNVPDYRPKLSVK
jgi:DNA replication protein DnaC